MKVDTYKQGAPSWAELMTSDADGARRFYAGLFGWESAGTPLPDGDVYYTERLDGDGVAGLGRQRPDEASAGVPPHWNVYLAVDNADEVVSRVSEAGGTVLMEPMDVMDLGCMAVLQDPTGAVIGLWQAMKHRGFDRTADPGTFSWAELSTSDPRRAADFYSKILGVPATDYPMPGAPPDSEPYRVVQAAEGQAFGIMKKTPEMGEMPNVWSTYWEVADADAVAARAAELGGRVLEAPFDVPTVGRIAVLADPQGAVFGVIKSEPMQQQA